MNERTVPGCLLTVLPRGTPPPDEASALDKLPALDERDHESICSGGGTHDHFSYLHTLTWANADETLELEQSLLNEMADDPRVDEEFESVCLDAEDPEDEPLAELHCLELGVAGAVATLTRRRS
jgi:hypothetical protein